LVPPYFFIFRRIRLRIKVIDVIRKMKNREYADQIEKHLRLISYPLAVKLLKVEEDIPEGAKRPKRDFGTCLSTCQVFALSRRFGKSIAMLKEDMWCPEPVIGYGLAEPPKYFLDGYNRYPHGVQTLEAGANWAREFPRLEAGKYIGIASAPLMTANFEPDLVIIYCNSVQLLRLLLASAYKNGRDITSKLSGHAACVYAVVPAIQTNKCQVSVPCRGDRGLAGTQDYEMIYTVPMEKMEDLVLGLEQKYTGKIPTEFKMIPEYKLSESYAKIARLLGMEKADGTEIHGYKERAPYE
jgi:uncharacterized protein (DUF169 family)